MRSQLSQFCQHFDTTVRPFLAPLDAAVQALAVADRDTPGDELRSRLGDVQQQMTALAEKVEGQQAYVLIFGPLKSGKSTLMNAISGAYVSEVSSLPAYPCLVFVGDGEKRAFTISNYDGQNEDCADAKALRERIDEAHEDLASHIRAAEAKGAQFDPQEHLPSAIRRVDVRLPAPALRKSGAVLVDTPGLYTRMRFGYDRMTRDFRNAAACAVFVVKTDNLFLEQVFTEFHQLLELFSRIFLVVNVDTHKRDVGPDGELVPSVEQHSPERIVEAFQNYAMSEPLRRAAKEGRLKLYPVDLLHAASSVLGQSSTAQPGSSKQGKQGGADPETKATAKKGAGGNSDVPASFARFRDDLEAYLASADYLVAFLNDSLQRAGALLRDTDHALTGDAMHALQAEARGASRRREACEGDLDSIRACLDRDWKAAFAAANHDLEQAVLRRARDEGGRVARAMGAAIDTWSLSSHSLHDLLAGDWAPQLRDLHATIAREARSLAEQACSAGRGGLELEHEVIDFLASQGIDLGELRQRTLAELPELGTPPEVMVPIDRDEVPVKRGVLQLVTMRSDQAVRLKLFGPRDKPNRKIPARLKKTRLGEPALNYLRETLMRFRKEVFPRFVREVLGHYRDRLRDATIEAVHQALREREPGLRAEAERFAAEEAALGKLITPLERLAEVTSDVAGKVHALHKQHANAAANAGDPVLQPQPSQRDVQPEPAPRRRRGAGSQGL